MLWAHGIKKSIVYIINVSEEDTVTIEKNSKVEENHTEMKDDVILKTERTCILGTYLT